jgi:hypothetical protein
MCDKLISALTEEIGQENTESLAIMVVRAKGRAIKRRTQQTIEIVFNEKGYIRHINGSDNIDGIKPETHRPE